MLRTSARWLVSSAALVMMTSCAIPNTIDALGDRSPPPEYGRPGWVRAFAGVGGWVGGIIGGVISIGTLPVTYPLSLVADEGLGEHASEEFLLAPAVGMSCVGHCLFGFPADLVDFTFRRAWQEQPMPITYDYAPLDGPELPGSPSDADRK